MVEDQNKGQQLGSEERMLIRLWRILFRLWRNSNSTILSSFDHV